jgi:sulfite exporter TauE/SafE
MNKIIISLFITGLLFGSGPCLASCGPFLAAYIAGTKKNIPKGAMTYILFSLARIFVYLVLSLAIFFFSKFAVEKLLGNLSRYLLILAGGIMVLIGLFLALGKKVEFSFWRFLHKNILERDKKSIITLGLIIGFLPCVPLLAILSYIGLISSSWLSSLLYSLSFGLGTLISPLLVLTIFVGLIPRFLEKNTIYYSVFSFICGLIIIFLGIQLIIKIF